MSKPYDEASHVSTENGSVNVLGPDGVDVSLTAKAAMKTAGRLDEAALDLLIENATNDQPS